MKLEELAAACSATGREQSLLGWGTAPLGNSQVGKDKGNIKKLSNQLRLKKCSARNEFNTFDFKMI